MTIIDAVRLAERWSSQGHETNRPPHKALAPSSRLEQIGRVRPPSIAEATKRTWRIAAILEGSRHQDVSITRDPGPAMAKIKGNN